MLIQGYDGSTTTTNMSSGDSSPIKYDRDFLIEIGNQPLTVFTVPESFLELAKEAGSSSSPTRQIGSVGPATSVLPPLTRGNSRGQLGGGMMFGGMNGYGGGGGGVGGGFAFGRLVVPPPPPISRNPVVPKKQMVTTTTEKLLVSDPNAWKPNKLKQRGAAPAPKEEEAQKSEEELLIEGIVKDTRGILNKLTPENFDRLMEKFMKLPLNDQEKRIAAVINVLFEKAIDEPAFSAAYARMVQTVCSSSPTTANIFRKLLLDKCQTEFQKSDTEEGKLVDINQELAEATDESKKELLRLEQEDLKFKMRRRSLGNVRFIGELFKLQMLSPKIMVQCVRMLLGNPDEEKLECLCKLLSTIGQKLDEQLKQLELQKKIPEEKMMDKFFATLEKLSGDKKIGSRIRFALMDLVDLRSNAWKPRRQASGPKTIEEVHRDAYLQEIEEKQKIQSLPPLSPDGPGGNRNHMPHVPKNSDWMTVGSQTRGARFVRNQPPASQLSSPSSGGYRS